MSVFADVQYCVNARIHIVWVGQKRSKKADVVYGWSLP